MKENAELKNKAAVPKPEPVKPPAAVHIDEGIKVKGKIQVTLLCD